MSQAAQIRTIFERIGFASSAATKITTDQGINLVDELNILDDNTSYYMCKVLRRPVGLLANGVTDPRVKVSARDEDNIKFSIYYVKHHEWVSRTFNIVTFTLPNILNLLKQRENDKNHTEPETTPKIESKDRPKTLEAIEEYLHQFRGMNDVPMSYVVQIKLQKNYSADDTITDYSILDEEMISCVPILAENDTVTVAELEKNVLLWIVI